ncbi:hypothetical protein HLH44_19915 [Gluconacetobacter sp. 1c LMG 22058]|uniref:Uncharacterized protein n=1 Tax=Gluconacetobacter dulcium TaxID=2729096 RepID=A0A7W4K3E8_9PROT|nr:hypothetical protein [Gluconacetobacter dulcium]MBB2199666.1 hypothetical protein [Gluconacetobacter dulcium]
MSDKQKADKQVHQEPTVTIPLLEVLSVAALGWLTGSFAMLLAFENAWCKMLGLVGFLWGLWTIGASIKRMIERQRHA